MYNKESIISSYTRPTMPTNELIPTVCPYCGQELKYDGIHLMCTNDKCSGRNKIKLYESLKVLDIKGLGEAMASNIYDMGFTTAISVLNLGVIAYKSQHISKNLQKVIDNINKIKSVTLEQVILMAGFDSMGKTTAKQVARKIAGLKYDFSGLEKAVVEGFDEGELNRRFIQEDIQYLKNICGVEVVYPKDEVSGATGVEFTGSPKPYFATKDEFLQKIAAKGFSHVSLKEAKMLVTDSYESTSSKMATAKKKGLEIYTYKDFYDKFIK